MSLISEMYVEMRVVKFGLRQALLCVRDVRPQAYELAEPPRHVARCVRRRRLVSCLRAATRNGAGGGWVLVVSSAARERDKRARAYARGTGAGLGHADAAPSRAHPARTPPPSSLSSRGWRHWVGGALPPRLSRAAWHTIRARARVRTWRVRASLACTNLEAARLVGRALDTRWADGSSRACTPSSQAGVLRQYCQPLQDRRRCNIL